ncbi:metallophosphoesterase [Desulfurococcaceae archaeon MEX13E-LK6-19]|nr:metallophosphoesterase [Desulfurococcaceae archaeon MEX13E-LK6-19]
MIIGVMSDSHDNMENVVKAFNFFRERGVNTIIHLGDIISPFIVRRMIKESWNDLVVYAVYGNNDGDKILLQKLFRERNWVISEGPCFIEIDGVKILAMHGFGSIEFTKNIVYAIAEKIDANIVLYGHTHRKDYKKLSNDKIVLNPGEVYGFLSGEATIAIVDTKTLEAEFIKI